MELVKDCETPLGLWTCFCSRTMIRNTLRRLSTSIVHEGDDKGLRKRPQHGFRAVVRSGSASMPRLPGCLAMH